MRAFSTKELLLDPQYFNAARHVDVQCPLHLHYYLEIVCVSDGEIIMNVNGRDRRIAAGQATFLLPFEQHSFCTPQTSRCFVIVFSPETVKEFYEGVKDKRLTSEVFAFDAGVLEFCDRILPNGHADAVDQKAVLYPLCRDILRVCTFSADGKAPDRTFVEAVRYVQQHFETENVTLTATAEALGVHHVYLSRLFAQNSDMSFTRYVNLLRCTAAAERIRNDTDRTLSEIALDVGFGSIRSFNRAFFACFGITPREYRSHP